MYERFAEASQVDSQPRFATLAGMELTVPHDLEARLARAASRRGVPAEALALEAIERAVEYEDWFLREVEKGLDQADRGEVLTHEEVGVRLEKQLAELKARS